MWLSTGIHIVQKRRCATQDFGESLYQRCSNISDAVQQIHLISLQLQSYRNHIRQKRVSNLIFDGNFCLDHPLSLLNAHMIQISCVYMTSAGIVNFRM